MSDVSLWVMLGVLFVLLLLSAFFSASETAMMRINRYRVRHLEKKGHRGARRVSRLLDKPDRLIGIILLGNNFVNILASSITTVIALRYFGEAWIALGAFILTMVILIFAELAPKTMAALHPERLAYPFSFVLKPMLMLAYPAVWFINLIANGLLKMVGVSVNNDAMQQLSSEEMSVVVREAGGLIPKRHQKMLINILDLEKAAVEDIMIPRNEVVGIDLENELDEIKEQLRNIQYTRVPLFRDDINNVVGILHMRDVVPLLVNEDWDVECLTALAMEPYFVPEGTPLNTQLLKFQRQKKRAGLVVDEYGDVEGMVTLEDILEEIVGEFTTDISESIQDVHPQEDGSFLVDGSVNIRVMNRIMGWSLPVEGPKTLNGLVIEYLESIPEPGTSFKMGDYAIEIVQVMDNMVKTARLRVV